MRRASVREAFGGAVSAKAGTGNEFARAAKFVPCPRFCDAPVSARLLAARFRQKRVQATNSQGRRSSSPVPGFATRQCQPGSLRRGFGKSGYRQRIRKGGEVRPLSPVLRRASVSEAFCGAVSAKTGTGNEFARAAKFVPCPRFCDAPVSARLLAARFRQKRVQATNSQGRRSSASVPGFATRQCQRGFLRRGFGKSGYRQRIRKGGEVRPLSPVLRRASVSEAFCGAVSAKTGTGNEFAGAAKFVPCPRFCDAPVSARLLAAGARFAPLASRVVIGIGRFLGRAGVFGDVSQVDADTGPGG